MTQDTQPAVTHVGVLDMQVCVPSRYTDVQVLDFAEAQNPCGTSGGWSIRREGSPYLLGSPERCPCEERTGFVHLMLDA